MSCWCFEHLRFAMYLIPMTHIFISYRRDDSKYQARMIYHAFCQVVAHDNVFMDIDSIPPGTNFRNILKKWVDDCDVLLALIGPGWIDASDSRTNQRRLDNPNDFVRIEIGEALARDIPVVPVLLDGTPMPQIDHLPEDLKELVDRQAELVEYRTFDSDVERLINKLGLGDKAKAPLDSGSSPNPTITTQSTIENRRTPDHIRAFAGALLSAKSKPKVTPDTPSTWSNIGRNAPCPCGSGKKYKHCHGNSPT